MTEDRAIKAYISRLLHNLYKAAPTKGSIRRNTSYRYGLSVSTLVYDNIVVGVENVSYQRNRY